MLLEEFGFLTIRGMKIKGGWTYFHPAVIVLACGAYYELIEMWVANIVAPDIGILFLGTQGDPWDTQHDMELAFIRRRNRYAFHLFVE